MAIFDITPRVLNEHNQIREIRKWLEDNVGRYLGRGYDLVVWIGDGWEIVTVRGEEKGNYTTGWSVDITDEHKSTLFGLTWL